METEELIKLVDGIYKNILEKFNPGARQMINAGKAYLKALHGAAAASRLYVDAISKLAKQAQQGTWGGSSDIGASLMKIVDVYKDIQEQQMNVLKAFYVDLLVPLETNLEKDTKVVQSEQKRFLQQHKQRSETFSKAAAIMKKQRKKSRTAQKTGLAMDKELKNMQVLEEEKTKLDTFCEQSLKNALTQERRRYGFVLERHCSLAKHHLSYHNQGLMAYQQNVDKWLEVAKTREFLPETVDNIFTNRKFQQASIWQSEDGYSNPRHTNYNDDDDDNISINSQLRKTKSMDASCLDIRSIGSPVTTLSRAKSEFHLNSEGVHSVKTVPPPPQWDTQLARALYAYLSSGENQLSFLEGDLISLVGDRNKGWQFGENLRTQSSGWFPLAYTELLDDNNGVSSPVDYNNDQKCQQAPPPGSPTTTVNNSAPPRMFGDTLNLHRSSNNAKQIRRAIASNNIPPPALPAPTPSSSHSYHPNKPNMSQSHSAATFKTENAFGGGQFAMKTSTSNFNFSTHPAGGGSRPTAPFPSHLQTKKMGGGANVSLHSSNDSGFSNDPPPQPEIDYSDDESVKIRKSRRQNDDNNNTLQKSASHSNSYGNLVQNTRYIPDEQESVRKIKIKRTKSFWKFGKNDEILEGMALWKHRDLVDVPKDVTNKEKRRRLSDDSDRTIKAEKREEKPKEPKKIVNRDQFYDDDGLMRTVNRKNILKQYNSSDSESEIISDDPYDSILVEDQRGPFPNVAEIGKKLEKLSKSSKFSPNNNNNRMLEKNLLNDNKFDEGKRHSFRTFGIESKDNKNDDNERNNKFIDSDEEMSEHRFIPRTKLSKTNSTSSKQEELSLMEYGETLQKRLKNPEYGQKYDEKSPLNGNMYGPWYDLWGLDGSTRK